MCAALIAIGASVILSLVLGRVLRVLQDPMEKEQR